MIKELVRTKTLDGFRFEGAFRIAVDGVCFASFDRPHCEHCLRRTKDGKTTYFHYALVAMLVAPCGLALPMEVEFIENTDEHGKPYSCEDEFKKQDCELKAFYRLAACLKEHYPRLPVCLLLDGLYCNQNVLSICEKDQWDYFITLQDNSVPALQKTILADLNAHPENRLRRQNKEAAQDYSWTTPVRHSFWNNWKKGDKHYIFAVFCTETADKATKFAYLCNFKPDRNNIEQLINEGGRQRWKIENQGFNTLKNHGMELEHGFGITGNCMQNYFLLRLIAFIIEQLMLHSNIFRKLQAQNSKQDIIQKPPIAFFRSMRSMATQLLSSLRMQNIDLPDIYTWRVTMNSS